MRFALIAATEQRGHLFHDARTNCVESRRITTSRATGYAVLQSPLLPLLRTDRPSSNRRGTYPRPSRSIGSMHRRGPSNDHPSSHLCPANRFVLSQLAPFPSRGALLRPTTRYRHLARSQPISCLVLSSSSTSGPRAVLALTSAGHASVRCYRAQLVLRVC